MKAKDMYVQHFVHPNRTIEINHYHIYLIDENGFIHDLTGLEDWNLYWSQFDAEDRMDGYTWHLCRDILRASRVMKEHLDDGPFTPRAPIYLSINA